MSKKELDEAIHHMERPAKPGFKAGKAQYVSGDVPAEQKGETLYFDVRGVWTPDENKCAAKTVNGVRGRRFFVKFCTDGPDKGHLLNPHSIYYRDGDDAAMVARRGRLRYEFRQCSDNAFSNYLKFLETKVFAFCQVAEREILNGS